MTMVVVKVSMEDESNVTFGMTNRSHKHETRLRTDLRRRRLRSNLRIAYTLLAFVARSLLIVRIIAVRSHLATQISLWSFAVSQPWILAIESLE